jgi:hypothetical protein
MSSQYSVVLRLRHPDVDPNEITQRLGIAPQYSWRAGEPRRPETADDDQGDAREDVVQSLTYRESCWMAELSTPSLLSAFVEAIVARRDPRAVGAPPRVVPPTAELHLVLAKMKRASAFWHEFVAQGGTIDCLLQVVGVERFQLEMSPALLALCAELRVTLAIEVDGLAQRAVVAA